MVQINFSPIKPLLPVLRQPQFPVGLARREIKKVVFPEPSFRAITIGDVAKGILFSGLSVAVLAMVCKFSYELGGANLTVITGLFTAFMIAHLLGPESNPKLD